AVVFQVEVAVAAGMARHTRNFAFDPDPGEGVLHGALEQVGKLADREFAEVRFGDGFRHAIQRGFVGHAPMIQPIGTRATGNDSLNILLVGSGGREHALAWALSASPLMTRLYCAPGNAGIAAVADCVPIQAADLDGLIAFAKEREIDFVVIGPEAPLAAGL